MPPTLSPIAPIPNSPSQTALKSLTPVPVAPVAADLTAPQAGDDRTAATSNITGYIDTNGVVDMMLTNNSGYFKGYMTDGEFYFESIPSGAYRLSVSIDGTESTCANIDLAGSNLSFNLAIHEGQCVATQ